MYRSFYGDDRIVFASKVWNMIQLSYSDLVGGFASAETVSQLLAKSTEWKLFFHNGEPIAGIVYKKRFGNKSIAGFSDRSKRGIIQCCKMIEHDAEVNYSWVEASGKALELMTAAGMPIISSSFAGILTGKQILSIINDSVYSRKIGNIYIYEKTIVGTVRLNHMEESLLNEQGFVLPETIFIKY